MEMKRALFEGDHPSVALSLYNVGVGNANLAKYDAALSFYTRALAMRQALFPADHPKVVLSLQELEKTKRQLAKQVGGGGVSRGCRLWGWLPVEVQWRLPCWWVAAYLRDACVLFGLLRAGIVA